MAWQLKGPRRLNVVSDAMAALGMPPGRYLLGDQEVIVSERDARLPSGTLAGSILSDGRGAAQVDRLHRLFAPRRPGDDHSTPADLLGIGHGARAAVRRGLCRPGAAHARRCEVRCAVRQPVYGYQCCHQHRFPSAAARQAVRQDNLQVG
jgi:hypothetical protein